MRTSRSHHSSSRRSWTRTLVSGALALGVFVPFGANAQVIPDPAELNVSNRAQVTITGEEVPNYLVTAHFYDYLLSALAEGHGTWTRYVLTPLGLEPETVAEAELETFLLEVRDTVTSSLHVAYDTDAERARFQRDQLSFRVQKMGKMATVHAELIQLLEKAGVGAQGMLDLMEREIRPRVTVSIATGPSKSGADRAREMSIFRYFDHALEAAKHGEALPSSASLWQKSSASGDVISLAGWPQFPNCGEGLVSRRGWHNLILVVKDRATSLSLTGRLKECGPGGTIVGSPCHKTVAATASGQSITCNSTAGDTLCRNMPQHAALQDASVQRSGMGPLTASNQSICTKPDRCDDFYPPLP